MRLKLKSHAFPNSADPDTVDRRQFLCTRFAHQWYTFGIATSTPFESYYAAARSNGQIGIPRNRTDSQDLSQARNGALIAIGKVEVDHDDTSCKTPPANILKAETESQKQKFRRDSKRGSAITREVLSFLHYNALNQLPAHPEPQRISGEQPR